MCHLPRSDARRKMWSQIVINLGVISPMNALIIISPAPKIRANRSGVRRWIANAKATVRVANSHGKMGNVVQRIRTRIAIEAVTMVIAPMASIVRRDSPIAMRISTTNHSISVKAIAVR